MCNEVLVVFHNWTNYDYYFIIKEITQSLRDKLSVLGKSAKHRKVENVFFSDSKRSCKN